MNENLVHKYHRQVERASGRHKREYARYLRLLTSGITSGRSYSERQIAAQLALADAALQDAQAAMQRWEEATNGTQADT